MSEQALQDRVDWQCFACGRLNERGLRIKSYWSGEEATCSWQPDPLYIGHPERLHAGLIATVMMCHLVWAATALAHRREGREIREPIDFTYGTKSFKMDILKPFSVHRAVTFRARVKEMEDDQATVLCSASVDGEVHASGEAVLFRFNPAALGPAP
jgi:hypothetical protein